MQFTKTETPSKEKRRKGDGGGDVKLRTTSQPYKQEGGEEEGREERGQEGRTVDRSRAILSTGGRPTPPNDEGLSLHQLLLRCSVQWMKEIYSGGQ